MLAFVLILTLVAACSNGTGGNGNPATPAPASSASASGSASASAAPENEAPKTAKLVTLNSHAQYDKNTEVEKRVHDIIMEKTGADIQVVFTTGDLFKNKINLMLAGSEQLDYAEISIPHAIELYKAGAIISINELLDKHGANLKENINPNGWKEVTYDGQILGVPGESPFITGNVLQVRTDWLEKLNLPVPTTIEDFEKTMEAFVNGDPDGNGIKDTWGLSPRHVPMFRMIATFAPYFLPQADQWWLDSDGKLKPPEMAPEFKDMMGKFIEWREKGWLWPETMTAGFEQQAEVIARNKVGAVAGWLTWIIAPWEQLVKGDVPEANFQVIGLQGQGINKLPSAKYADNVTVITRKSEHPDVVMKFLDYNSTDEGYKLTLYGPEGENYTVQPNGTYKFISEDPDDVNKAQYNAKYYIFSKVLKEGLKWPIDSFVYNKYNLVTDASNTLPRFDAVDKHVFYDQSLWASAAKLTDLETYLDEHRLKVFSGEIPLADWDKVMQKWRELGGDLLIADKTAQYHASQQ